MTKWPAYTTHTTQQETRRTERNEHLKPTERSLGIQKEKHPKYPKNLNNCVIKHKLQVPCDSFEEN